MSLKIGDVFLHKWVNKEEAEYEYGVIIDKNIDGKRLGYLNLLENELSTFSIGCDFEKDCILITNNKNMTSKLFKELHPELII